jgi:autotransporter-associated beta strand protein
MNRKQVAVSNRLQSNTLRHGRRAARTAFVSLAAGAACQALFASAVHGQTFTWTQATGTSNWSTAANWAGGVAPTSSTTTTLDFFDPSNTTGPASGTTVEGDNDIANPFLVNVLNLNGETTTAGPGAIVNIGGNPIQMDGTNAQINFNAAYGLSTDAGTTYNVNANMTFNTATTLTFANNGGNLNFNDAIAGTGTLNIVNNEPNRYVNFNGLASGGSTYTGNINVNAGALLLGAHANIFGNNVGATQITTVASGASLIYEQANGEYDQLQTLILNGNGTGATGNLGADAALDVDGIDYNNMYLSHGIAINTASTIRVDEGNTSSNSWGVFLNGGPGLVGTGNLTKIGTGYLILNRASNASAPIGSYGAYSGNVNVNQGVMVQFGNVNNAMGPNTSGTQTVTVASGASFVDAGFQYGTSSNPQIFVINGTGTGRAVSGALGTDAAFASIMSNFGSNTIGGLVVATNSTVRVNGYSAPSAPNFGLTVNGPLAGAGTLTKIGSNNDTFSLWYYPATQLTTDGTLEFNASAAAVGSYPAFTGNVVVPANSGVLATGHADNALGTNTSGTQVVSIGAGSSMLFDEGNAAFNNPQNFVINGTGTGDTIALSGTQAGSDAAMQALEVNFNNVRIGGLDIASNSTVRINTHTGPAAPNLGIQVTGPLAGAGNLTIIGASNDTIQHQNNTFVEGYGTMILTATAGTVGGTADAAFSGNVTVGNGTASGAVLILRGTSNALGPNTGGSQTVTVTNGSAAVVDGANGAYSNPQIFVINGTGTGDATVGAVGANASFQATNINFANATIGGLNLASASTVSVTSTVGFGLQVNSGLAGSGDLSLIGGGTLILSAPASGYTGSNVNVNTATLDVSNASGSATGSAAVNLTSAVLTSDSGAVGGNVSADSASMLAPGGVGSVGTLTVGGLTTAAGTTLNFDLGTGAGPIITNGDLLTLGSGTISIASGTLLTLAGTTVAGDDYRLIGGTIAGITLGNFSLPTAPAGQTYSLSKAVDSGFIDLVVGSTGPATLTWNDASLDNLWNTTSSNWNNGTSNATYSNGSAVVFNDSNGGHYSVTLNTTVSPASVTVNNASNTYVIGGTGSIAGTAALSKSGAGNLTLNTVNTYTGGTNVSGGTLTIGVTGALPNGAVGITGGTLKLAVSTGLASIKSLAISGTGTFDISNNHVVINYGAPANDPISSIIALLKTGYNSGAWNGLGGIDSSAVAGNSGYTIGYADAADVGNPAGLASGTIEVAFTLIGDADLNHTVNGIDFGILAANFNKTVSRWDQGDFDYNNIVNGIDFTALAANFNKAASSASDLAALEAFAAANGLLADVPEPATLGFLAVGACGLLARRRRCATSSM